jgi:hypothetical protein
VTDPDEGPLDPLGPLIFIAVLGTGCVLYLLAALGLI